MDDAGLGLATELMVVGLDGAVTRREGYTVLRWPAVATSWSANKLVFDAPPGPGDLERWEARFVAEIPARHRSFAWCGARGVIEPFTGAGYAFEVCDVLAAPRTTVPPQAADVRVRPLESDDEWAQVLAIERTNRGEIPAEDYERFVSPRLERFRAMSLRGDGWWFGAFDGARVVGALGVYGRDGVGRYQSVVTHPDHRRRGVARRLVADAGHHALERYDRLVILVEPDSSAERAYRSCGFRPVGHVFELTRPP